MYQAVCNVCFEGDYEELLQHVVAVTEAMHWCIGGNIVGVCCYGYWAHTEVPLMVHWN